MSFLAATWWLGQSRRRQPWPSRRTGNNAAAVGGGGTARSRAGLRLLIVGSEGASSDPQIPAMEALFVERAAVRGNTLALGTATVAATDTR